MLEKIFTLRDMEYFPGMISAGGQDNASFYAQFYHIWCNIYLIFHT
jgi:hypothetical protein